MSETIKGKPELLDHGVCDMPFEFLATCVEETCPNP